MKQKYIIQRWTDVLEEERANSLVKAIRIKRKFKSMGGNAYCCIIKVAFEKRHPDFPIWFSLISLLLVGLSVNRK
jgi:hypothetical protein